MEIVKPAVELLITENPVSILKRIEACGRVCYKSEGNITPDSYINFLKGIIKREHLAVLEHGSLTILVKCDRGVSHEIVRHRIGSYCQESQRYVRYITGIEVIKPHFEDKALSVKWDSAIKFAEETYKELIARGIKPEIARSVLPNATKTEIAITYNFREWRHFLELRGSKAAHPQMREIAIMILEEFHKQIPVIFEDFVVKEGLIEKIK